MLGKIEGRSRRGRQRLRWLDGITNLDGPGLCCFMRVSTSSIIAPARAAPLFVPPKINTQVLQSKCTHVKWYFADSSQFAPGSLFSCSVMSDSFQPHGLQHPSTPFPSPTPRACSKSCLSSWWCHPTISTSVSPFSFCLQSFPASGSFPMSRLFTSGSQSFGASASASDPPRNIQDWFPLGLTGWISLKSKGLSSLLQHHSSKASILWC